LFFLGGKGGFSKNKFLGSKQLLYLLLNCSLTAILFSVFNEFVILVMVDEDVRDEFDEDAVVEGTIFKSGFSMLSYKDLLSSDRKFFVLI
jgi:hypothetical protein